MCGEYGPQRPNFWATSGPQISQSSSLWSFSQKFSTGFALAGLAPDILKMESWTHMGHTANRDIKDIIHIFAFICKNMRILLMGRRYRER